MHNCKYCDRELKSKAGMLRHESACKMKALSDELEEMLDKQLDPDTRDIWFNGEQTEEDIVNVENGIDIELSDNNVDAMYLVEKYNNIVQLEVMGGEETYYDGHPRRAIKLKGLLSRTFDKRERHKIRQLIMKVENETR